MTETSIREALDQALRTVRVVDPHCHLNPGKPTARTLADVLLYHHVWIEMVSAGMGQREVTESGLPHELVDPGIPPEERLRRALPWFAEIRTTTVGVLLRKLLADLYDFHTPLDAGSLPALEAAFARRNGGAGWSDELFDRHCGIERLVSVEAAGRPEDARILAASEVLSLVNIVDGKHEPRQVLEAMDRTLGREVRSAADYEEMLGKAVAALPLSRLKFLGAWVQADMTPELATEREVTRILKRARRGEALSRAEKGSVTYHGMRAALTRMRATPLRTIQLITGAEVRPPHRSLTTSSGVFAGALARLAGEFEDFHFSTSTASEAHVQDLAVLAKHFPNISVAGYWWHTFYPSAIRRSLELRLDIVPAGKIVGFFSDAYHAEWCYPKLWLVKRVLGELLTERVASGWYRLEDALALIPKILEETPRRIYGTG